ncbi:MAG: murein biosynthesis integral membrane protein MurJ [Pseudomonadota bacterium]
MALLRSASTGAGMTMISRVLGFVRDAVMASVLGTGLIADAFVIAFRLPNLFRRLFAEGAFNAAFVPLFARRLEGEGQPAATRFAEEVLACLLVFLISLSALAMLAMPLVIYLLGPGFIDNPEKFDVTVHMSRIAFPYLTFMSLVALVGGILNSLHRFAAAAAAPIILNIVLVAVLVMALVSGWGPEPRTGYALVWGVSAAGLLQFLMLWFVVNRAGVKLKLRRPKITPGVRRLVTLGIPGLIAGGITQINLAVSTAISTLQDSAPSWLWYADRIYQLPLGVIGIAIGIVLLPELSRRLRADDSDGVHSSQNRALEISLLLTIPSAIALIAMPHPIVHVLFERGVFSAEDSRATSIALAAFAAGLPAFVMIKVFSPAFFAREDTRTPMKFALISVVINVTGALVLFPFIAYVGIALATTVAGWVNAMLLGYTLSRRGDFALDARMRKALPRIIAASLTMGFALLAIMQFASPLFSADTLLVVRLVMLAALVGFGAAIYFAMAWWIGALDVAALKQSFSRKGG